MSRLVWQRSRCATAFIAPTNLLQNEGVLVIFTGRVGNTLHIFHYAPRDQCRVRNERSDDARFPSAPSKEERRFNGNILSDCTFGLRLIGVTSLLRSSTVCVASQETAAVVVALEQRRLGHEELSSKSGSVRLKPTCCGAFGLDSTG